MFKCDQCNMKKKTENKLRVHINTIHNRIKRNLSEMKKGPVQTTSMKLSPPKKKPKAGTADPESNIEDNKMDAEITPEVDNRNKIILSLQTTNMSLNDLLTKREKQIQVQANKIENYKQEKNDTLKKHDDMVTKNKNLINRPKIQLKRVSRKKSLLKTTWKL